MRKLFVLLFMSFIFAIKAKAQLDSNVISPIKLGVKDIAILQKDSVIYQINSAMQSPININQSPFETYIITQEQIKQFGCNTLIDVLSLVPSIRTSKVGSAIEGELFMANGMRGNSNFQFLINDVPIRPYLALGMSLGANLPIKQAERIEVILGSMASIYGPSAGAGVINFILKESERPIYTSSSLTFGSEKYSNIDVNFGGKIGKGKNVMRFNAYGGFTSINNLKLKEDWDNFDSKSYIPLTQIDSFPDNLRVDSSNFFNYKMPSYSRHVGFDLKSKHFTLAYRDLLRRNHSAMGLNPAAVGYLDVGTTLEDNISNLSILFKKQNKKWLLKGYLSFVSYKISEQSNTGFVYPQMASFLNDFSAELKNNGYKGKFLNQINNMKDSISRFYRYTNALERSSMFNFAISRNFVKYFTFGAALTTYIPLETQRLNFFDVKNGFNKGQSLPSLLKRNGRGYFLFSTGLTFKKDNTLIEYQQTSFVELLGLGGNRRISFSQGLMKNKSLVLFGNFGKGKITPPPRYVNTNYSIALLEDPNKLNKFISFAKDIKEINLISIGNQHIKQTCFGLGIRNSFLNVYYQFQETKNLYFYKMPFMIKDTTLEYIKNSNHNIIYQYQTGFLNESSSKQNINKLVFSLNIKEAILVFNKLPFNFDSQIGYTLHWGSEITPTGKISVLRQMPKHSISYNVRCRVKKNLSISYKTNYFSEFYSSNTTPQNINQLEKGSFFSNDIFFSYNFNDNLQVQAFINNFFNRNNAGIEATETPDDLRLNTQQSRIFQIGLIYNLDKQK